MTNVELIYLNDGCIIECRGHAHAGPYGQDIVCAGISALCMALARRIQTLQAEGLVQVEDQHASDGEWGMEVTFSQEKVSRLIAQSAVETVAAGFRAVAEMYPENVSFEEI